jgi:hypothetical protein
MKQWANKTLWALIIAISIFVSFDTLSYPTNAQNIIFGFSIQRLLLLLFPTLTILFSALMLLSKNIFNNQYSKINNLLNKIPENTLAILVSLSFWLFFFLSLFLIYYKLRLAPNSAYLLPILGIKFQSLINYIDRLWGNLALLAVLMLLSFTFALKSEKFHLANHLTKFLYSGVFTLAIFLTFFQWLIFLFELHVFEQIPGWYWPIIHKSNFSDNLLIFLLIFVILSGLLFLQKFFKRHHWTFLLFLSIAFIFIQYSIGFMEGKGITSLADRFFLSYHRVYIETACNSDVSSYTAVSHYEELFDSMFLQTKPPGVLWSAFGITKVANAFGVSSLMDIIANKIVLSESIPTMSSTSCRRSMVLVSLLFPMLSVLPIWLIYWFYKKILQIDEYQSISTYSSILFILAPNIVMLSLFYDQVIYPSVFLFLAGITILSVQKKSIWLSFFSGVLLYFALFITFSLLPILAVPIAYFICLIWQKMDKNYFWELFKKTLLPMGIGILFSIPILKFTINYDIYVRYKNMMATMIEWDFYSKFNLVTQESETFFGKIGQIWDAAALNNTELAVAIGIPTFIFFAAMGVKSIISVAKKNNNSVDMINVSLFLPYVLLNVIRVVLGEAGRLWMFWIPVMSILAIQFIYPLIRKKKWIFIILLLIQVITLFLSYQFQDYFMPQLLPG